MVAPEFLVKLGFLGGGGGGRGDCQFQGTLLSHCQWESRGRGGLAVMEVAKGGDGSRSGTDVNIILFYVFTTL